MRKLLMGLSCALSVWVTARGLAGEEPLRISGVYPHLTVFNNGAGESGIGAVAPWADRLWLLTYPQHATKGSPDKLYEIDDKLNLIVRPESVGGTHACRMIHRESNQLIIGPYFIDAQRNVRAADVTKLTGRMTAVARHLTDPANLVYFFDMEGAIYEVNVHTLDVKLLFAKPVPGWHGKGGYTSQGRLVIANNGEAASGKAPGKFLAEGPAVAQDSILRHNDPENAGALAEWDGKDWRVILRRQFTDVTGPGGIYGAPDDRSPLWSIGWDRRSVILMLLDGGRWHSFRLPKASHTYDPKHGWYTEWPRIREIGPQQFLMTMHGMMYDFPSTFSAANSAGIKPVCSYLRIIPDFCSWNGRVVLGADETTIMQNPMAGRCQTNLWFGQYAELRNFGPRAGWGGPWLGDLVKAGVASEPFLVNGFEQRCLHLAVGGENAAAENETTVFRCTGSFPVTKLPRALAGLARVSIARGDYHKPAPGYSFNVNQDVVVFLAVDDRPQPALGAGWEKTEMKTAWGEKTDTVYKKAFKAGSVEIPGHPAAHKANDYGVPHLCFIQPAAGGAGQLEITGLQGGLGARVTLPAPGEAAKPEPVLEPAAGEVTFTLESDVRGDGHWAEYKSITVPASGYAFHIFPPDFAAQWVRVKANRDCRATAYFHYSMPGHDPKAGGALFAGLADVKDTAVCTGLIRPAKDLSLQFVASKTDAGATSEAGYFELNGGPGKEFARGEAGRAEEVRTLCQVKPEFEVDEASAIMKFKGQRYRLPKGAAQFDKPFAWGQPRCIREVETERNLVNVHGTFYEMPREDGLPLIKPVCSHSKQISDFCTWHGLLVISGTKPDAKPDGHYFGTEGGIGLWFGQIEDLWKLGKPVGKGGPWLRWPVLAGAPSDPYLMTGFDKKSVQLSHDGREEVQFTLEVDVTHHGWKEYKTFAVAPGQTITHTFPEGYSAHWVRVRANKDCTATAAFSYE